MKVMTHTLQRRTQCGRSLHLCDDGDQQLNILSILLSFSLLFFALLAHI